MSLGYGAFSRLSSSRSQLTPRGPAPRSPTRRTIHRLRRVDPTGQTAGDERRVSRATPGSVPRPCRRPTADSDLLALRSRSSVAAPTPQHHTAMTTSEVTVDQPEQSFSSVRLRPRGSGCIGTSHWWLENPGKVRDSLSVSDESLVSRRLAHGTLCPRSDPLGSSLWRAPWEARRVSWAFVLPSPLGKGSRESDVAQG